MIRVKMELHSAVARTRDCTLVEILIVNDGTSDTAARGHYDYTIKGNRGQVIKRGRIEDWPRRSKTACALLQTVVNHAYPKGAK